MSIIDAKSYVSAIRENLMAGGDSCSRAVMIGACLGKLIGIKGWQRCQFVILNFKILYLLSGDVCVRSELL